MGCHRQEGSRSKDEEVRSRQRGHVQLVYATRLFHRCRPPSRVRRVPERLASRLATKWDKSYSVVVAWVRVQTQFAIIRAVDLRLRGTRRRLVGLTMQDGAGLGIGH